MVIDRAGIIRNGANPNRPKRDHDEGLGLGISLTQVPFPLRELDIPVTRKSYI